jgi:putative PIN family toxin of toxin-antitoxin system
MRIVLDTNVLVSGLYNPYGPPGRIIDLILSGQIKVLYDDRVLEEYRDVLARPQLAIDATVAQSIISYLRLAGERIAALPLPEDALSDVDDLPFAEVALSGRADALVTGNVKHFAAMADREVKVLSPARLLEQFV